MNNEDYKNKLCEHCGGLLRIRNPTGKCDHLYYPDYCEVCKKRFADHKETEQ